MIINTSMRRKDSDIETEQCFVEKIISLNERDFEYLKNHLLEDSAFIIENKQHMGFDEDGTRHCILAVNTDGTDGILIDSQGSNYARYTAYVPNANKYLKNEQYPALNKYTDKVANVADEIVNRALEGQLNGYYTANLNKICLEKNCSVDENLIMQMLGDREEIESGVYNEGLIDIRVSPDYIFSNDKEYKSIDKDEIAVRIAKHCLWLHDVEGGSQADLSGAIIKGYCFDNMDLCNANLSEARFEDCSFKNTSLCFADLQNTKFCNCNLEGFTAEESLFNNSEFNNCNIEKGYLTHSNLTGAKFIDCSANKASFAMCCLENFKSFGTDLHSVNMTDVVYSFSDWNNDVRTLNMEM